MVPTLMGCVADSMVVACGEQQNESMLDSAIEFEYG